MADVSGALPSLLSPLFLCLSGRCSLLLPLEQEPLVLLPSNDPSLSCHSSLLRTVFWYWTRVRTSARSGGTSPAATRGWLEKVGGGELGVWGEVVVEVLCLLVYTVVETILPGVQAKKTLQYKS